MCSFTFADGRRCRTPRSSGHALFCYFHARKEAQAQAAEQIGSDISYFLSGSYLSACDLSLALGRIFVAVARGQVKPKTASTLAYLGQTLLQTIQLAEHEYTNSFGSACWRGVIYSHVKANAKYLAPALAQEASQTTAHALDQDSDQNPQPITEGDLEPDTVASSE